MIRRIAEYTVRDGELDAVENAIARFVDAVRTHEPATTYHAYRRTGSNAFIHFMAFPNDDAQRTHRQADYTAEFVAALYPRCLEEPVFTDLRAVAGEGI